MMAKLLDDKNAEVQNMAVTWCVPPPRLTPSNRHASHMLPTPALPALDLSAPESP